MRPLHYNGDRPHDHYNKRRRDVARKVDRETGEQWEHGNGLDEDVRQDVIEKGKDAFCPLEPSFCEKHPLVCLGLAGARALRPPLWIPAPPGQVPANAL